MGKQRGFYMQQEDRITRNLRHMAWERAKGELNSMLHTFWGNDGTTEFESCRPRSGRVEQGHPGHLRDPITIVSP